MRRAISDDPNDNTKDLLNLEAKQDDERKKIRRAKLQAIVDAEDLKKQLKNEVKKKK